MAVKQETELYPPVKAFFTGRGYEVKAEIRGCDLVALHPDRSEPVIVEMKRIFTLPLLLQGADRQKTGAQVWLAVERNRTKKGAHNQRFNELTALCRRLGLGFMTVTFYKTKAPVVEIWCEPGVSSGRAAAAPALHAAEEAEAYAVPAAGRRRKAEAGRLMKEFEARSGDYNVGGSTKRKLMTAYREKAIQCALALACSGPSAPRLVREKTGCPTAANVLRSNYYGWYIRIAKGVYKLTPAGFQALKEYGHVTAVWVSRFPWAQEWEQLDQMEGASLT